MIFLGFQKKILSTKYSFEKRRMLIEKNISILRSPNFWDEYLLSDANVKKDVINIASKISKYFSKYKWLFEDDELLKKYLMYNMSCLMFWEAKIDATTPENVQKWQKNIEEDEEEVRKHIFAKISVTEDEFQKLLEEIPIDLF